MVELAYASPLCRVPDYAASIKTNRPKALEILGCLRASH